MSLYGGKHMVFYVFMECVLQVLHKVPNKHPTTTIHELKTQYLDLSFMYVYFYINQ